jgi:hypothetical protein
VWRRSCIAPSSRRRPLEALANGDRRARGIVELGSSSRGRLGGAALRLGGAALRLRFGLRFGFAWNPTGLAGVAEVT